MIEPEMLPSPARSGRAARIAGCLGLLAAFAVAVHAPRERADWSLDDYDYVAGNPSIRSVPDALAAFAEPFPPQLPQKGLYRPLTNLTYAIDFARWGDDGRGYHESNVALYVLVVWLVFTLAAGYDGSLGFGLAVALGFAAHPVHCEAVDSVTGRSEVLSLLFALASLVLFQRAVRTARAAVGSGLRQALPWLAGSAAAFALSALAKETGLVLPALLAVHFLVYGRRDGEELSAWARRCGVLLALHGAVAIAYLAVRWYALPAFTPPSEVGSWISRPVAVGVAFFLDLRALVWPLVSRVDFYWGQFFSGTKALLPLGFGALLLGLALRGFVTRLREQIRTPAQSDARKIELCALAIFLVFLLPVSHVFPVGAKFAERLLFAPSLGFVLFVASRLRELLRHRVAAPSTRALVASVLVAILAVLGGIRSHERALDWRDDLRLWQAEDRALPGDPRVQANLAIAYLARGRWQESHDAIARARSGAAQSPGLAPVIDGIERALQRAEHRAP